MIARKGYPDKALCIVTSGVGGSADLVACVLARELALSLGQEVTVDNRATPAITMEVIAAARPDGYSLLVCGSALWNGPLLQGKPADVFSDFAPITLATSAPNILVVHPSLPVKSVQDLIALAESEPGKLRYSSGSKGSSSYLAGELFKLMTGVDIVPVDYSATGAIDDLISGKVQMMFATSGVAAPHLGSDRLRAIAVTSSQPSMLAPGLPTVAASGLPGFESATLIGLFAPAKTPDAVIAVINRESVRILHNPDIRKEINGAAMDTVGDSVDEFTHTIKSEMAQMRKLAGRISATKT